jgi:hypothetical protein
LIFLNTILFSSLAGEWISFWQKGLNKSGHGLIYQHRLLAALNLSELCSSIGVPLA